MSRKNLHATVGTKHHAVKSFNSRYKANHPHYIGITEYTFKDN